MERRKNTRQQGLQNGRTIGQGRRSRKRAHALAAATPTGYKAAYANYSFLAIRLAMDCRCSYLGRKRRLGHAHYYCPYPCHRQTRQRWPQRHGSPHSGPLRRRPGFSWPPACRGQCACPAGRRARPATHARRHFAVDARHAALLNVCGCLACGHYLPAGVSCG